MMVHSSASFRVTAAATGSGWRRFVSAALSAAAILAAGGATAVVAPSSRLHAQAGAGEGMQEVAPLDCWWRTSVSAITVGQPFTLVLTCAVVDTETATVVVDRARLDPRAIELAPFEVLSGSVAPDVKAGDRTFFQVQYSLRFINAAFFNQDISLPNLAVNYRVQTRGGQGTATQGIERRFAMPAQSIRVNSLVPADAADIRDASTLTFADLDAIASRGRVMATGGLLLFGLAAAIALVGVGRTVGARRGTAKAVSHELGDTAVLLGAARALAAIRRRREGSGGYADADVADALAATRIVADCLLDRTPSQQIARGDETGQSGTLDLRRRWRRRRVLVSGSATAKGVAAAAAARPAERSRLAALQAALSTLTQAQYRDPAAAGTSGAADVALDEAIADVGRLANRLAVERAPVIRWFTRRFWRRTEELAH